MPYQSLYRRYRPGSFDQMIGQKHVVKALKNAVQNNTTGHAYLFSGPRGTGKTSAARVLAKALNCLDLKNGEPCGECSSCIAFAESASYDLHELDAASNNKVDDMRELIGKVSLGTPGKRKVYVLDEVHMLTSGAENALLKTLEEPPAHVCFVMCTTEPHKVADTIISRSQHLQFKLVPADEMLGHVRWVVADAGLDVGEEDISYAVREGAGSVRDTLSTLDQVVAAQGAPEQSKYLEALLDAVSDKDSGQAIVALDEAIQAGREPRVIAEELVVELRNAFLCAMGVERAHLLPTELERAQHRAERTPMPAITNAMESLGEAMVRMRHAPDPRLELELVFLKTCSREQPKTVQQPTQQRETQQHRAQQREARQRETQSKSTQQYEQPRRQRASRTPDSSQTPVEPSRGPGDAARKALEQNALNQNGRTNQTNRTSTAPQGKSPPSRPVHGQSVQRPPANQQDPNNQQPPEINQPRPPEPPVEDESPPVASEMSVEPSPEPAAENQQKSKTEQAAEAVGITSESMAKLEKHFTHIKPASRPLAPRRLKNSINQNPGNQNPGNQNPGNQNPGDGNPLSKKPDSQTVDLPNRDELTHVWADIYPSLPAGSKFLLSEARMLDPVEGNVRIALPQYLPQYMEQNANPDRANPDELTKKFSDYFDFAVPVIILEDDSSAPPPPGEDYLRGQPPPQDEPVALKELAALDGPAEIAQDGSLAATDATPAIPQDGLF